MLPVAVGTDYVNVSIGILVGYEHIVRHEGGRNDVGLQLGGSEGSGLVIRHIGREPEVEGELLFRSSSEVEEH